MLWCNVVVFSRGKGCNLFPGCFLKPGILYVSLYHLKDIIYRKSGFCMGIVPQIRFFKFCSCHFFIFCAFYQIYSALLSVRASSSPSASLGPPFFLQNQIRIYVNQCQSLSLPGERAQIMTCRACCDNFCVNQVPASPERKVLLFP